jgi:signal transduction histidine kinase
VQLTLLYAVPFFISGAALLTIPLVGIKSTVPANNAAPAPDRTDTSPVVVASVIGLVVMALVSIALGWWIAGRFLRPLRTITATARDISASNLHRRLGLRGRDEFAALAATLDDLFERLQSSFESQRHFVANASHELRTPLTAERALLQVALADPAATVDTLRAACQDVLALGEQQENTIDALLTLASTERGIERREPIDLAAAVTEVLESRRDLAARLRVSVDEHIGAATTTGDALLIESLVANLVDNAVRHNTSGGWMRVATSTVDSRARFSVENSGAVIPPKQVDRLFQPFQRLHGRAQRTEGHGLGLAIVQAIATAHGATLSATARPDGGLAIEVTFAP